MHLLPLALRALWPCSLCIVNLSPLIFPYCDPFSKGTAFRCNVPYRRVLVSLAFALRGTTPTLLYGLRVASLRLPKLLTWPYRNILINRWPNRFPFLSKGIEPYPKVCFYMASLCYFYPALCLTRICTYRKRIFLVPIFNNDYLPYWITLFIYRLESGRSLLESAPSGAARHNPYHLFMPSLSNPQEWFNMANMI